MEGKMTSEALCAKFNDLGTRFGWFRRPIDETIILLSKEIENRKNLERKSSHSDKSIQNLVIHTENTSSDHHRNTPIILADSDCTDSSDAVSRPASAEPFASPPQPKSLRQRMLQKYNPENSVDDSDSDDLESFFTKHRTPIPLRLSGTRQSGTPSDLERTKKTKSRGSLDDFIVSDEDSSDDDERPVLDCDREVFEDEPALNKDNLPETWTFATPKPVNKPPGLKTSALTTGGKSRKTKYTPSNRTASSATPPRPGSTLDSIVTPYSNAKNFKKGKEQLAKELFELYNNTVFEKKLPADFSITWNNKMRSTAGFCYYGRKAGINTARIELADKVIDSADRLRDTLIHEMCHAAAWLISGVKAGHGPVWKKWAARANYILQDLPPISRCHTYKINAKFVYACTNEFCSNTISRHSKSINTEKQRCGYCHRSQRNKSKTKQMQETIEKGNITIKRPSKGATLITKFFGTSVSNNTDNASEKRKSDEILHQEATSSEIENPSHVPRDSCSKSQTFNPVRSGVPVSKNLSNLRKDFSSEILIDTSITIQRFSNSKIKTCNLTSTVPDSESDIISSGPRVPESSGIGTPSPAPLYFLYDCEGTGGSVYSDHIIEIAASVQPLPEEVNLTTTEEFQSLVYTSKKIPRIVSNKCGIKKRTLRAKPDLSKVLTKFSKWLKIVTFLVERSTGKPHYPVLLAHNGFSYDFPILLSEISRRKDMDQNILSFVQFGDTLVHLSSEKINQRRCSRLVLKWEWKVCFLRISPKKTTMHTERLRMLEP
ncbi:uncharacterized protein LOC5522005 isoform X2 [Nematostella vectensis]|uniref:uncharacterized protein LOC5522005 isoform X2 n=1 Tax=Nematostella vectensis TaxID=45351 RepID=UPI0013905DEA|nr:uncharacterized protein LOC5522005 isoform X2 [Nematostella vectensis]